MYLGEASISEKNGNIEMNMGKMAWLYGTIIIGSIILL